MENFQVFNLNDEENFTKQKERHRKPQRKITQQRLKNIGLYYLQRYESSVDNLRLVLQRRIEKYAYENPQWDKREAYQWVEDILEEFEKLHYLDDFRFAEMKVRNYLNAGKPARYIYNKLREKGIDEQQIESILSVQEYDEYAMALKLAKRKKIGPYRDESLRREYRQKDMGTLVRAGFSYDVVRQVLDSTLE